MRTRLIVAFIAVALLAALASAWLASVMLPFFPSLHGLIPVPKPFVFQFVTSMHGHPAGMLRPGRLAALAFFLAPPVLLLAVIIGLAFAASRPVLKPVRRLAQAAERMSGGDLAVRVQPEGRDELARLIVSFNEMASVLEHKVGELRANGGTGAAIRRRRLPRAANAAHGDDRGERRARRERGTDR